MLVLRYVIESHTNLGHDIKAYTYVQMELSIDGENCEDLHCINIFRLKCMEDHGGIHLRNNK